VDKGFPRPRATVNSKSYPVPYSADEKSISNIDDARMRECLNDQLCIVCGTPVDTTCHVMLQANEWHPEPLLMAESGPFHDKCLTMTLNMCPHLIDNPKYSRSVMLFTDLKESIMHWWTRSA
jgi:hypothetical protein